MSCCVPDLHFDYFLVDVDGLESKINSDGDHIVFVEVVVCEPLEEGTLADCRVAHHHEFEQVIVLLAPHSNYYNTGTQNLRII